jgi:D-alanyl-D-alanine carboxypeptidase
VTCHRAMLPALADALAEVERRGLSDLVDPSDFQGCFNPVLLDGPATLSRHAWGLAVDLNASDNPYGGPSRQDPRLVEIMEAHGFVFGGRWPTPDPMHFEYRGEPRSGT